MQVVGPGILGAGAAVGNNERTAGDPLKGHPCAVCTSTPH